MNLKPAKLITGTAEVLCPHCGEPKPAPDVGRFKGSHTWWTQQIRVAEGKRVCSTCLKKFGLSVPDKVLLR